MHCSEHVSYNIHCSECQHVNPPEERTYPLVNVAGKMANDKLIAHRQELREQGVEVM